MNAFVCLSTGQETVITLAWFARRKAEVEETFELEEFLRSVELVKDGDPQAPRQALSMSIVPPRTKPHVRLRQASGAHGDRQQRSKSVVPSEPPAVPSEPARPGLDERLDEALVETFPASDPIAVSAAS
jgi:hypothetical protein